MVDKLLHGYAYDAAGRLVKEGAKTYRYGYLDKVLSVTEGNTRYTYGYHVDGQLASATKYVAAKPKKGEKPKAPETEEFFWDGLALVKRGGTSYVNEPHPGGGAAVLSSKDGVMFNDILGTTLGVEGEGGYTATPLTAFGDAAGGAQSSGADALFTGKPHVDGLGHAFLFRNYRAGLGKWLTADPLGYPDGWNQLAYGNNAVLAGVDIMGGTFWEVVLDFGIAFNDFVATLPKVENGNGHGGLILDQQGIRRPKKSMGYEVELRLNVSWDNLKSLISGVTNFSADLANIWFNDGANHVMGLNSHDNTYDGFMSWLSDESAFLNFVEDYIPNMHETSIIHDEWVGYLLSHGASMSAINTPTMVPAYMTALMVNLIFTGKSLVDLIEEFAE